MKLENARANFALIRILAILAIALVIFAIANLHAAADNPKPDAAASAKAFLEIHKVFTSPRCQNCHDAGDAPLQGDDSHVHLQNVKRGKDGHGVSAMRCETCHQATNLAGDHMPPGNPKWGLPSPGHKMVFVGRTPAELCRQLKDPKQTGGRSLQQLLEHVADDELVAWGWNPGLGREPVPGTQARLGELIQGWIDTGAQCP